MSAEDRRAKLSPTRGRIAPAKLAHVVRRTARFEEMIAWYETVLAARVVHGDGMLAFLTYDDEHHRIAIARIPGIEDGPQMAAGTDHIAFTLEPGDVISTGTPSGVGGAMQPPAFLRAGDVVKIEVERIGTIQNRVIDEPEEVTHVG